MDWKKIKIPNRFTFPSLFDDQDIKVLAVFQCAQNDFIEIWRVIEDKKEVYFLFDAGSYMGEFDDFFKAAREAKELDNDIVPSFIRRKYRKKFGKNL